MGIKNPYFRGKAKAKGRPTEFAKAELMVKHGEENIIDRKRKRFFFTLLDILAIFSLGVAIYSFYLGNVRNGFLSLLVGVIILGYFSLRNYFRSK